MLKLPHPPNTKIIFYLKKLWDSLGKIFFIASNRGCIAVRDCKYCIVRFLSKIPLKITEIDISNVLSITLAFVHAFHALAR